MSRLWSSHDEEEIRKIFMKNLNIACYDVIKKFAECASGRTFSTLWKCHSEKQSMNECMRLNALPENYDRARDIYMERIQAKRISKEKHN
ncbi:hypothetical protein MERGE_002033 [Pneumocystis wakefieldiae]|uniref:COX assembly mitochondrial protein n=1 Tax=Pneumocystis wakefieldiae TaxID=38082 RepID=A0A899FSJ0_9ASCO|nr:hypothetical protein MERGE_002033 [Pneumocystis wakefieldiae]